LGQLNSQPCKSRHMCLPDCQHISISYPHPLSSPNPRPHSRPHVPGELTRCSSINIKIVRLPTRKSHVMFGFIYNQPIPIRISPKKKIKKQKTNNENTTKRFVSYRMRIRVLVPHILILFICYFHVASSCFLFIPFLFCVLLSFCCFRMFAWHIFISFLLFIVIVANILKIFNRKLLHFIENIAFSTFVFSILILLECDKMVPSYEYVLIFG